MANEQELSNFIWSIAESLRGPFSRGEYGEVVLPFTLLRRLDCVLATTKSEVLEAYEENKDRMNPDALEEILKSIPPVPFHNTSDYSFDNFLDDPNNLEKNVKHYVNSFSANIREILNHFDFENTITKLARKDKLGPVIDKFSEIDLHPSNVSNHEMGTIFEEIVRRFNEALDENPGEHFTPRDVVRLMSELVFAPDIDHLKQDDSGIRWIYDPCAGTGGMLTETHDCIKDINENIEVELFGQEVNDETYAICKSDILIQEEDESAAENIVNGNVLTDDQHANKTFDYMLSNPPYGDDWDDEEDDVMREAERGDKGRFEAGTPSTSDGQFLFIQTMIDKMQEEKEGGSRMAIITNASPLFTGEPTKKETENESAIRRWILENDWLDTLIRLPKQMFYNTDITTYIWVLTNRKPEERKNKIQLIDASSEDFWTLLDSNKGKKRRKISEGTIEEILDLYLLYEDTEFSQIHDVSEFGYRKVEILRPERKNFQASEDRITRLKEETKFQNRDEETQQNILDALQNMSDQLYMDKENFKEVLYQEWEAITDETLYAKDRDMVYDVLGEIDQEAEKVKDRQGRVQANTDLSDDEYIPLEKDVQEYFDEEVKPYVRDAWINEDLTDEKDGKVGKIGYEINFNRYFYEYEPPRPIGEIEDDIEEVEEEILNMIKEVTKV
jgi:type I restriction enzyme M protein